MGRQGVERYLPGSSPVQVSWQAGDALGHNGITAWATCEGAEELREHIGGGAPGGVMSGLSRAYPQVVQGERAGVAELFGPLDYGLLSAVMCWVGLPVAWAGYVLPNLNREPRPIEEP